MRSFETIAELKDLLGQEIGVSDWSGYVDVDRRFLRPAEVELLIGDPSKISASRTGPFSPSNV